MELLFALDLPDWLQWALRIKNLLLGGVIVALVVGGVLEDRRKRAGRTPPAQDQSPLRDA